MRYSQNIPVCHFNFGKNDRALDLIQKFRESILGSCSGTWDAKFVNDESTSETFDFQRLMGGGKRSRELSNLDEALLIPCGH